MSLCVLVMEYQQTDTLGYSGQELADRVNVFGSFVNLDKNNRIWLGSPLRVHRRCDSPMFEISNKIAYGNTMIHANTGHVPGEIASIIGRSAWFDIKPENANFEGYWVKEQYELGILLGVKGTPSLFLEDGSVMPGYLPADRLLQVLEEKK